MIRNNPACATKHELISNSVRADILSGKLRPGDRLPPDLELAERFGVDKRTVAKGMTTLVREGLLSRATKRGTTVLSSSAISPRSSNAVGIIACNHGHFYEDVAKGINKRLFAAGLYPVWIDWELYNDVVSQPGNTQILQVLESILHDRPYGFIIDADRSIPFDFIKANINRMGHLVYLFHYLHEEKLPGSYCLVDMFESGRSAAAYLAGKGYKRLAYLSVETTRHGFTYDDPHVLIANGMESFCRENGLAFDSATTMRFFNGELPMNVLGELKEQNLLPDAVMTHSDSFCMREILPACGALNIRIPQDMAVMGYFNTPWCTAVHPALTSMAVEADRLAEESVRMLLSPIHQEMTLESSIVERQST